jgi:hypothetical protein
MKASIWIHAAILLGGGTLIASARYPQDQQLGHDQTVPIATVWTLDALDAPQKTTVKSVLLIECRKAGHKGTAFLLKTGTVVTAFHVVDGCEKTDLSARSPMGQTISFGAMESDKTRDLAILRPNEHLEGGLELGKDVEPPPEAKVKTWGFPLRYEGAAPLLSMGYVAGYVSRRPGDRTVKHLIINGAFNPGNSGGPLILERDNSVVGVVVSKWTLFSPDIEAAINGFHHPRASMGGTFTEKLPDGTTRGLSDQEVIARVLQEFYEDSQVMIGEAISASELRAFLREKGSNLTRTQ